MQPFAPGSRCEAPRVARSSVPRNPIHSQNCRCERTVSVCRVCVRAIVRQKRERERERAKRDETRLACSEAGDVDHACEACDRVRGAAPMRSWKRCVLCQLCASCVGPFGSRLGSRAMFERRAAILVTICASLRAVVGVCMHVCRVCRVMLLCCPSAARSSWFMHRIHIYGPQVHGPVPADRAVARS